MNQREQGSLIIKRLKIKLGALAILLALLSLSSILVLSGLTAVRFALALSGNYSKTTGQQLTAAEWNNLPADFVARTGGAGSAMQGALDLGNNRITNLAGPTATNDAATRQYVDTAVLGAGGGGDTFVNWGQGTCPAGSALLYSGFAFNGYYSVAGGSAEPTCIQSGDAGPAVASEADGLYPLGTGSANMPPGITPQKEVRCAVCYDAGGTCYERWGSTDCPGAGGFAPAYTGFAMSGWRGHEQKINRLCVNNVGFDGSVDNNNWGAILDSSMIWSNTDVGLYTPNTFLKCAICCN